MREALDDMVLAQQSAGPGRLCRHADAREIERRRRAARARLDRRPGQRSFERFRGPSKCRCRTWAGTMFARCGARGCSTARSTSARFYFLHSYYFECDRAQDVAATTEYGSDFCCAVDSGNIFGVQFHPEKSHHFGARPAEELRGAVRC